MSSLKLKAILAMALCLFGSALLLSQAPAQQPIPEVATTATTIPGVVAAGTPVQLIWTGYQSADGITGAPDGSLLFTEQAASRISKIDQDGKISVFLEDVNNAGALGFDSKGRLIAIERGKPQVRALTPVRTILAEAADGKPLVGLRDLGLDKKDGVYFTDGRARPLNSAVYYIRPNGQLTLVTEEIGAANGVLLSPDDKTLYVTDTPTEYVVVFDIQADGSVTNKRNFARMEGPQRNGADGLAVDAAGRLYVASPIGVQVFSPQGQHLGTIPMSRPATSVAFAGEDKKTLYIVGRGTGDPARGAEQNARTMYKVAMQAQGFKNRAK